MLTAVVLVKNEAKNLPTCLESLSFCDEIVIVNDNSSDSSVQIAKKFKAKVLNHSLDRSFADQRNWAQEEIKSPWLLYVDADEQISPELAKNIRKAIEDPGATKGYYLRRTDTLWGHTLKFGDAGSSWILRLARRGAGEWIGAVHEVWVIEGENKRLSGEIFHNPHHDLKQFLSHLNFYSSLRSQELHSKKASASLLSVIVYPPSKFIFLWIFKRGFLDGTIGFIHAMAMAFYSFLVRGKHYLLLRGIPHA